MLNADKIRELMSRASFLIFALPLLYMCFVVLSQGVPDMPNAGDSALLELSTRNLFSRHILLGPYSRFFFFHPGPLYFFVRFPLYILSGCRTSSFLITTSLLVMASVLGAWHMVRKRLGGTAALLFSVCIAFYLLQADKAVWLSDWNPYVITFPVLLFSVSAAAFAARFKGAFWMMVLSGSFVAQTHLAGIPALATAFAVGLLCMVYQWMITLRKSSAPPIVWKQYLLGMVLLVMLWLPPVYQQISAEGKGNMTKIQEFFQEGTPDIGSSEAFTAWSSTLSRSELAGYFFPRLIRRDPEGVTALLIVAVRLLLLSVAFSLLRRRGDQPFISALVLVCIGMHGATWYSVTQIRGELNSYLTEWISIISPLSAFVILFSFLTLFREKLQKMKIKPVYFSAALLTVLVLVTSQTVEDVTGYFRTELHPSWENEIAVRELSGQLSTALDKNGTDFYILNLQTQQSWAVLFGVMNQLEKQGYPIGVQDNYMYVHTPVPEGMNPRTLYIGVFGEEQTALPGLVASYNGTGLILQ